jgi:prepilin-type N-terminal cleavage/methylation domain-containing protein
MPFPKPLRRSRCDGVSTRRGFSLIEALVVLVVAGMALMLVFSIGLRAVDAGFRLGRRSLDTADLRFADEALRRIVRGVEMAPLDATTSAPTVPRFVGDARGFTGDALLQVAAPCAEAGPVRALSVRLQARPEGDVLVCAVEGGSSTLLLDLRPRRARFAYSGDGAAWRDDWRPSRSPLGREPAVTPREQSVFVRLATDDGAIQVIERAGSGRPGLARRDGPDPNGPITGGPSAPPTFGEPEL